jgi:enediyne polyketide synthase
MTPAVAIIGMACRYPDANSPAELWENVLAQRRAFRQIPSERLRIEDYLLTDRYPSDSIHSIEAAFIEGYEFDRVRFRVAGSTYRSTDLAHWLALDIAAKALSDAGFDAGEELPREMTGVIVGNTLTGEFSRANLLRLRWPFVRRVLEPQLIKEGWSPSRRQEFLDELENHYKKPFPAVGEETLAGGLSNTIAGRICNYFDLKGGGYTVDGACASSLLAVTTACSALAVGDLDMAVVGGVDLSLDPFELIGFARTAALAVGDMRVYDARSSGFWPGEGCGFVVLMRQEDALAQGRRIYSVIRGWGISSDGSGGITRPEIEGQLLALQRAYRRAGFGIDTIPFIEGHGTGTSVGDTTELRALSRARRETASDISPAVISSIKANIGHTKAAAGIAGLIKATMALETQILPPMTGCKEPHSELMCESPALEVLSRGRLWPSDYPLRAGVSAMGFGGINTHVTLEKSNTERRKTLSRRECALVSSSQDCELFLLGGSDEADLLRQVEQLLAICPRLSRAELGDVAAVLESALDYHKARAAVLASTPAKMTERLRTLREWLMQGITTKIDTRASVFLGKERGAPRIGFLFPGQSSPAPPTGGALQHRFESVQALYARAALPVSGYSIATKTAQPAIVTASLAGLAVLDQLGINAVIGVGHSLGELTAFHWAGGLDEEALLRIVNARADAMSALNVPPGSMASVRAGLKEVEELLNGVPVSIACLNSPHQTVISGETTQVDEVVSRLQAKGIAAVTLPVSHAFHSPHMSGAVAELRERLNKEIFQSLKTTVVSSVTGSALTPDEDLRSLLCKQVTFPVRFAEAVDKAASEVDLFIEVGPGHLLSGIVADFIRTPVVTLNAGGQSFKGLLQAVGAAFVLGAPIKHAELFKGRFTRHFNLDWQPKFFVNPCELAPLPETSIQRRDKQDAPPEHSLAERREVEEGEAVESTIDLPQESTNPSILDLLRQLVAQRAELPASVIREDHRLLSDLHLNSITASQIVTEAARRLGLRRPVAPTNYSDAMVSEIAESLEELTLTADSTQGDDEQRLPAGVDAWIRGFTIEMVERPLPRRTPVILTGSCDVIAPDDYEMGSLLKKALEGWEGGGATVVCLPPEPDERHVDLLLRSARAVLDEPGPARFILVQSGGGAASFARTLHLERPELITCVIDIPQKSEAIDWVLAEIKGAAGYTEANYDASGKRWEPVLRLLEPATEKVELPVGRSDVLLVTGGGKGITAECALSLARETGVNLVLVGLSDPDQDQELSSNLQRFAASGINHRYFACDITDASALRAVVIEATKSLGQVTAILHGAALNIPQLLRNMDRSSFLKTLAIKVQGARNILAAVDRSRLRAFITFGSIIARTGLPGESHYGLANEWLTRLTEQLQQSNPACRCLSIEWSVWSGVGMAQRIGGIDKLVQAGITPITPDEGVSILHSLLTRRLPVVSVVVTGRYGALPTLNVKASDLPLLRFLEKPLVHYPGVELVADVQLSAEADPYLPDHAFQGERLFPAVLGLEAMAQAACAVTGSTDLPDIENVQFVRPIVVPDGESITIRLAALVREPNRVEVVLRSQQTAFQVDHFRATFDFNKAQQPRSDWVRLSTDERELSLLPINPEEDLYGELLFHKGRFRRIGGYRWLKAKECFADIIPNEKENWFGRYLPATLVLGDPAVHDAAIHAIQPCIPHATLLPIGVNRIQINAAQEPGPKFVRAKERSREGDTFTYDLDLLDGAGTVIEHWEGLSLRVLSMRNVQIPWVEPLLGVYLERMVNELIPEAEVAIALDLDSVAPRRARSNHAIERALGHYVSIIRRFDGKPEVPGGSNVSSSHCGSLTLGVAGFSALGCDIEEVTTRPVTVWLDLLGPERLKLAETIVQEIGDDLDTAATRVWSAGECLKKAGANINAPLMLIWAHSDGWVKLAAGSMTVATFITTVRSMPKRLSLAVLASSEAATLSEASPRL